MDKEPHLPYYLLSWWRTEVKWKILCPGSELWLLIPFPTTMTITLSVPPQT